MRESMNAGILVLLGVTAVVLACFLRFFVALARRSREAAHLVDPFSHAGAGHLHRGFGARGFSRPTDSV